MGDLIVPYLLTCSPLIVAVAAWGRLHRSRQSGWPRPIALVALGVVTANAFFAASSFLYGRIIHSYEKLPPWQDPTTLNLALLFLLAPVGIVLGLIAAFRGAPGWIVVVVETLSVFLFVVGVLASGSV